MQRLSSLSLSRVRASLVCLTAVAGLALCGCQKQASDQTTFQSGEPVVAGPLTYNVVQTQWRSELGELSKQRTPENRFLVVTLSATNKGHQSLSLPFFALDGDNGQEYKESENGAGIENWFGLLREIAPGNTIQGTILFDVPLKSYRLRLTDGGDPGSERLVWVDLPLNLNTDADTRVTVPSTGK